MKETKKILPLVKTVCVAVLIAVAVLALGLAACSPDEPTHKHSLVAVERKDATCTQKGNEAYWKCEECGKLFSDKAGKTEIDAIPEILSLGHHTEWTAVDNQTHIKKCVRCDYTEGVAEPHNFEGGECADCGAKKVVKPYTLSEDGSTLTFGSYPQSQVEDTALQSMLNAEIQNKTPTADEFNGWTDYEYLDNKIAKSYMWYIDVEYQDALYRGVYLSQYRPYSSTTNCSPSNTYQLNNGYETGTVYWFEYEPITWRILTQQDGKVFLMADLILDSQNFYINAYERTGESTIYANNYKESDIRFWLNHNFYDTAFDELCKEYVVVTEVDNSVETTPREDTTYICENTIDNVFLLSYADVNNEDYNKGDLALLSTAYCQGVWLNFYDCGKWWLRSPAADGSLPASYSACMVNAMGADSVEAVTSTAVGVVPALWLTL